MVVSIVKKIFQRHPIMLNAAIYGGLYVGAEFTQQIINRKIMVKSGEEKEIDLASLGRYLVIGSGFNAHYLYYWYKWLDSKFDGSGTRIIIKKLLLDQIVMTPPLYVIFYVGMSIMEGQNGIFKECREKFFKTLLMSYLFWVPFQILNFVFLPSNFRVIYLGACSFVWMNILCWLKRGNE